MRRKKEESPFYPAMRHAVRYGWLQNLLSYPDTKDGKVLERRMVKSCNTATEE